MIIQFDQFNKCKGFHFLSSRIVHSSQHRTTDDAKYIKLYASEMSNSGEHDKMDNI